MKQFRFAGYIDECANRECLGVGIWRLSVNMCHEIGNSCVRQCWQFLKPEEKRVKVQ